MDLGIAENISVLTECRLGSQNKFFPLKSCLRVELKNRTFVPYTQTHTHTHTHTHPTWGKVARECRLQLATSKNKVKITRFLFASIQLQSVQMKAHSEAYLPGPGMRSSHLTAHHTAFNTVLQVSGLGLQLSQHWGGEIVSSLGCHVVC